MAINLHFFRDSNLDKLDFEKVLEFFDHHNEFRIYYDDEVVEVVYSDDVFGFSYRYFITKKSRVSNIYKINPQFSNVNFYLEMPVLIPTFLAKEILTITQRLCKLFELEVYHEAFGDVKQFNLVEVLVLFEQIRADFIEENGMQGKYRFRFERLNEICRYQRSIRDLTEFYKREVHVPRIVPIVDRVTNEFGMSVTWKIGTPGLFPPHIAYVYVENEKTGKFLVKFSELHKLLDKYMKEVGDFLPNMFVIKDRQARQTKKFVKKLRKNAMVDQNYKEVRLAEVIDQSE